MFSNWCNVLCSRIFSCTVIALTGSYKVQTKWTKLAVSHISFFSSCRHHQARSSESGWGKKRVSLVSSKTPTKCHLTLSSFHLTLLKTTIVTLKNREHEDLDIWACFQPQLGDSDMWTVAKISQPSQFCSAWHWCGWKENWAGCAS